MSEEDLEWVVELTNPMDEYERHYAELASHYGSGEVRVLGPPEEAGWRWQVVDLYGRTLAEGLEWSLEEAKRRVQDWEDANASLREELASCAPCPFPQTFVVNSVVRLDDEETYAVRFRDADQHDLNALVALGFDGSGGRTGAVWIDALAPLSEDELLGRRLVDAAWALHDVLSPYRPAN